MNFRSNANHRPPSGSVQYFETRLRTAGPLELTVILYDVLLEALGRGSAAAQACRIEDRINATNRAIAALTELRCALDHKRGGELAQSLDRLYAYAIARATGSVAGNALSDLQSLQNLFAPLREAWATAAAAQAAPAPGTVGGGAVANPVLAGLRA
jgi:flagellar protein FliS